MEVAVPLLKRLPPTWTDSPTCLRRNLPKSLHPVVQRRLYPRAVKTVILAGAEPIVEQRRNPPRQFRVLFRFSSAFEITVPASDEYKPLAGRKAAKERQFKFYFFCLIVIVKL